MFDQQRHGQYFYEKKIPSVEALVVFVVDRVEDLAASGHLPAYADVEAPLPSADYPGASGSDLDMHTWRRILEPHNPPLMMYSHRQRGPLK